MIRCPFEAVLGSKSQVGHRGHAPAQRIFSSLVSQLGRARMTTDWNDITRIAVPALLLLLGRRILASTFRSQSSKFTRADLYDRSATATNLVFSPFLKAADRIIIASLTYGVCKILIGFLLSDQGKGYSTNRECFASLCEYHQLSDNTTTNA